MSQKLLAGGFKWAEDTSQFNSEFIKNYNEDSEKCFRIFNMNFDNISSPTILSKIS